jgi:hypothetical protein
VAGLLKTLVTTNRKTEIVKELYITLVLTKIQDYKKKWMQHINRLLRNRIPRVINNKPKGRRN